MTVPVRQFTIIELTPHEFEKLHGMFAFAFSNEGLDVSSGEG
jgi:hypothetical protein